MILNEINSEIFKTMWKYIRKGAENQIYLRGKQMRILKTNTR